MVGGAILDRAKAHQSAGVGERRERVVMGGASAVVVAQCRAGFPFGGRLLSGLPHLVWPRLECPRSDAHPDRRQGRRQFAAGLTARFGVAALGSLAAAFGLFAVAAGRSASAIAATRPSANSSSSRASGPTLAAACTGWPCSSRTRAKPRVNTLRYDSAPRS